MIASPVLEDARSVRRELVTTYDGAFLELPPLSPDASVEERKDREAERNEREASRLAYLNGDLEAWRAWPTSRAPVVFLVRALERAEEDRLLCEARCVREAYRLQRMREGCPADLAAEAAARASLDWYHLGAFRVACLRASQQGEKLREWKGETLLALDARVRMQIGSLITAQTEVSDPFSAP